MYSDKARLIFSRRPAFHMTIVLESDERAGNNERTIADVIAVLRERWPASAVLYEGKSSAYICIYSNTSSKNGAALDSLRNVMHHIQAIFHNIRYVPRASTFSQVCLFLLMTGYTNL